ncbi:MAG: MltR family transcriptional regulator [Verrucomicrobia bacterium]|nr:MltR family transcriptional regulator [Verrucomicrobiota bacterium]
MKKNIPASDSDLQVRRIEVLRELASESDRGVVLVGASLLEENLELILRSVMNQEERAVKNVIDPLFEGNGAFATFSAKIKCCYALSLIDQKMFEDLETIRAIRNDFAHSYRGASFSSQTVNDRVNNLHTGKVLEDRLSSSGQNIRMILEEGKPGSEMPVAKRRFIMSVSFLSALTEGNVRGFREFFGQRQDKD